MEQAINELFKIVQYHLQFINEIFNGLYRSDLSIFGVPYYQWIIILLVGGALFGFITSLLED